MTIYNWEIDKLTTETINGYSDAVTVAYWKCYLSHGDIYACINSKTILPPPHSPFTPYGDLTQDQVLGWCWSNGVNKTSVEHLVQLQVDSQMNPQPEVVPSNPDLPW